MVVLPKLDAGQELLIDIQTGELWAVDSYALRERGYPEGAWKLYKDVSKEELVYSLQKATGNLNEDME